MISDEQLRAVLKYQQPLLEPASVRRRGQLVLAVDGAPFGPHHGQLDNRVFTDELEHFPGAWQDAILDQYRAMGMTRLSLGPGWALGYKVGEHRQYPDSDWRITQQADDVIATAQRAADRGISIKLVVGPDKGTPYWVDDQLGWRLDLLGQELGPIYRRLLPYVSAVQLEWEIIASSDALCNLVLWVRESLGWKGRIVYHTQEGHMWPGLGEEDEKTVALNFFAAGGTTIGLQGFNPDADTHLPEPQQTIYDIRDCKRRITAVPVDLHDGKGFTNGFGLSAPMVNCDGVLADVELTEWLAESFYKGWFGVTQTVVRAHADMALAAGASESGDG